MRKKIKNISKNPKVLPRTQAIDPRSIKITNGPKINNGTSVAPGWGGMIGAAATAGGKMLMDVFGVKDNSQAGVTLNSSMQGAEIGGAISPGWGHLIGGIAGGLVGSLKKGSVDENTGEIHYGGIFGRSKASLEREHDRVVTSLLDRQLTQNMQMDWYNDPNNSMNNNIFVAAEGGIARKPVDAFVSKGELIYDPTTKKLRQVPGSKGKPNRADDVYAKLYEGDVVISNSPTMLMANGKTPAQNLMGMVDKYATGGTVKAREAIIKKVVNWQEANKTKPQEYAKFDEGHPGFFKYLMDNRTRPLDAVMSEWFRQRGEVAPKFNGFGKLDFLKGIKNIYNAQSNYEAPIKLRDDFNWDQHRSVPIDQLFEFNPNILTTKVEKPKNTSTKSTTKVNYSPQNIGIHTHSEIDPVRSRHKTNDNSISTKDISEVEAYSNDVNNTDNNVSARVQSENGKNVRKKPVVTGTIKNPILSEYDRLSFAEPFQFNNKHLRYAPGNYVPIKPLDIEVEDEVVDEIGLPKDKTKSNINWGDLAYKAAVLTQPLWGKAKPESVQYQVPVAKYRPTYVDIDPQRKAIDESYAMARYNLSNINPSTGAGMAYGLQAASNRAKQLADVYSWQTNTQNSIIGQNVDTYNKWSADYANIMNNVYDKAAANKAAARNINRQNIAAALSNYGQMMRDDKQFEQEITNNQLKTKLLKPLIKSVYENSDELMSTLAQYTTNKNIKKKSTIR